MNRRKKQIGVPLGLLAIACFALAMPAYKWYRSTRTASTELYNRTKAVVDKNPRLQPAWDKAMQDGVLTSGEAAEILEAGGEKVEPDK